MERGRLEVDPVHYVSAEQLACDALSQKTGVELHLIPDRAMYLLIVSGMLGGVWRIIKRHARANNRLLGNVDLGQPLQEHRPLGRQQTECGGNVTLHANDPFLLAGEGGVRED